MSQHQIFDYNSECNALEDLFNKVQCPLDMVNAQSESGDRNQKQNIALDEALELNLGQLQRRQSIAYESAQEQVAVLKNLLKAVKPDWMVGSSQLKPGAVAAAPQAYRFKDIYEQKKQQLLRQKLIAEHEQRQFHSRPMPNFRHVHQQLLNRPVVHRITCPITPNVLKRRQRETEQRKLESHPKPMSKLNTFPLKAATVYSDNNNNTNRSSAPCKPFRLSTELRAEQRKRFNALTQEMQENRRREQEEHRQRLEKQQYQKLRELATFRARPNPFRTQLESPFVEE